MRRVFSIAMTAWAAKVRTSSICRSVNGSTRCRASNQDPDRFAFPQQRHAELRPNPRDLDELGQGIFGISSRICDLNRLAFE